MNVIISAAAAPAELYKGEKLTQTLRELERHGIVEREDFGEVPPRVECRLSLLGQPLSGLVIEIEKWVSANYTRMAGSARRYDAA